MQTLVQEFFQDLRYAARQLVRGRASTVVAVLALALGIGANTSVFTLLNAMRFNFAPVANRALYSALDPTARRHVGPVVALTMIVPTLVLLIACANVANLLLARALARRKEFAMRRALGATRARLIRQLLTESVMLSAIAGVVGVILSLWMTSLITHIGNIPLRIAATFAPDLRVLGATAILALLTGIILGLAPALSATKPSVAPALKNEDVMPGLGRPRRRSRNALVSGRVAVSLVLLITAGLFLESLSKSLRVDLGVDARNALALSNVMPLNQMLGNSADIQQVASAMLGVFGGLALLLAALGMYGVTAHGVVLRTKEIGIRMSLGAQAGDVLSLFVRDGVGRSLINVAIGLGLSATVSALSAKFLFGLGAMDTFAFAIGATILCVVAAVASYVPARRAAKVDPMVALKYE